VSTATTPSARQHASGEFAVVTLDGRNTIHVTDAGHTHACAAAFAQAAAPLDGQAPGAGDLRGSAGRRLPPRSSWPQPPAKTRSRPLGKYRRRLSLDAYDEAVAAHQAGPEGGPVTTLAKSIDALYFGYKPAAGHLEGCRWRGTDMWEVTRHTWLSINGDRRR
jgi:hypothetical protein